MDKFGEISMIKTGKLVLGCLAVLFVFVFVILHVPTATDCSKLPYTYEGGVNYLDGWSPWAILCISGSDPIPVAIIEDVTHSRVDFSHDNSNTVSYTELFGEGSVIKVDSETHVIVTNLFKDLAQVKITSGEYSGKIGWTYYRWLK